MIRSSGRSLGNRLRGLPCELADTGIERSEPGIARKSASESDIDLLDDHRDLEQAKHMIVAHVARAKSSSLGVSLHQFLARQRTRKPRWADERCRQLLDLGRLDPIPELVPKSMSGSPMVAISQSNTVETCAGRSGSNATLSNLKSLWMSEAPLSDGHSGRQPFRHRVHFRNLVGLRVAVSFGPAFDLAPHVSVRFAEIAQTGVVRIDFVQIRQRVDQRAAHLAEEFRITRQVRAASSRRRMRPRRRSIT